LPLNAVKPVCVALTSNAAQVAGLGRIYFVLFSPKIFRGLARIKATPTVTPTAGTILILDNSLFVLLYWPCTYAAEKILFVSSFPKLLRDIHKRLAANIGFALQR
jgi:hypothetical protein